jgi:CRISPR-associated protein Csb2
LSGVALALPADTAGALRVEVLRAANRVAELAPGRLGKWKLEPAALARPPATLRADSWTAHPHGATQWSSVTPFVFDQHPKAKDKTAYLHESAVMISAACERIGLRRPHEVIVTSVSAHLGVPPAHAFPRLRRKDGSERRHTHAILVFAEPVCGPILVGAGRYRGYGFFRAMDSHDA